MKDGLKRTIAVNGIPICDVYNDAHAKKRAMLEPEENPNATIKMYAWDNTLYHFDKTSGMFIED